MKKILLNILLIILAVAGAQAQVKDRLHYMPSNVFKPSSAGENIPSSPRDMTCDTLRFPMSGTITYYYISPPDSGYVTGNNSYGDKAKAEFYESIDPDYVITGFVAEFAVATSKKNSNADITFGIWDNSGAQGKPGNLVASATYPLNWIIEDIEKQWLTIAELDNPYKPTGPFYVGVVLPQTHGDTIALWCREDNSTYTGTAWEQWKDNSWHDIATSWKINTSMLIHPVICKTLGIGEQNVHQIAVMPNPSDGRINIKTWQYTNSLHIEVYAYDGSKVLSKTFTNGSQIVNLDISRLPKGMYVLQLYDDHYRSSQKIVVN
ncbi:hypothetical protein MASR1M74_15590 [Lentimicrobium sp.]